jgi:chitinase
LVHGVKIVGAAALIYNRLPSEARMNSLSNSLRISALISCSALALTLFAISVPLSAQTDSVPAKRLVGYYPEWAKENTPPYTAKQIPYSKLTHIEHAFVLVASGANGDLYIPPKMIEPDLISKAHAAGVKVLVSIGGGGGGQGVQFNKMSASETARENFVSNVAAFLNKYGYDGVDIDWEVPNTENRADCTLLMQELRNALPSPWLISMAVTADPENYGIGLDIPALAPIVDFFNVMTYDYYGTWSGATGLVSPLLQDPADPEQAGSVKTSMDLYQYHYGVPLNQLDIGTPFYGYEWDGVDTIWTACASCASYSWNYGTYIKQRIGKQGWATNYDSAARAPYLTNASIPGFITYDGVESTERKVEYVKSRGFGGVFMWSLDEDYDGHSQDLLDAMYEAWK